MPWSRQREEWRARFNLRAETRSAFHIGVNMSARGFSDIFPLLPRQSAT